MNGFGWVDLTSDKSYSSELLPTVCDPSRRMIRRHVITILIRHGEDGYTTLVPLDVQFGREHAGDYTQDRFYMHQVPLA